MTDLASRTPVGVSPALQHEVEQFYFAEAKLIDDRRFDEWYELLADDLVYWMPIRRNFQTGRSADEWGSADDIAVFDDDKETMGWRVKRLSRGMAWAEEPPSRTRHLVTNVVIQPNGDDELEVESAFLVYRTRLETQVDHFVGARHDLLRRHSEHGFQIARRHILLDQSVLLANNISIFF